MSVELSEMMVTVVEPSQMQRKIVTRYLNNQGLTNISYAESGGEALEMMRDYSPELVISALYLPDMTGTDLVTAIRSEEQLEETAFMLISSETRFRYLDPIRQAGVTAILPKPFSEKELMVALNTTLEYYNANDLELECLETESMHLLIVDDSRMARNHIRRVFQNMGIEHITEASDGLEALELLSDHFFDLVVTDYNMPRMDGKELVEQIRNQSEQASVPILMVTSEENTNRLAAVQNAGVSAVCDKPFEPTTVRTLIKQIVCMTD